MHVADSIAIRATLFIQSCGSRLVECSPFCDSFFFHGSLNNVVDRGFEAAVRRQ